MDAYKKLERHFSEITVLKQIESLLDWDSSVMMPDEGSAQRGRQAEVLGVKIHALQTAPEVGASIAKTDKKNLEEWQRANFDLIVWQYEHATALPEELVAAKMRQETQTEMIWRKSRAESDFKSAAPALQALLNIVREQASAKAGKLGLSPYDSLMDPYAPGMTTADVDAVFDDLGAFLPPFIDAVLETQKAPLPLPGPFAREKQEKLCRMAAEKLGFEKFWSRLDASAHPFSTGIGGDVRITTRYDEADFMSALSSTVHEVGHGLYDRHTPDVWRDHPAGASQNMGMVIHESQSLSLDMQLARGRAYWVAMAPGVQEVLGVSGPAFSADNLYRHATAVSRGFIRVDADEVTYPAHVILRYRLEKDMVAGRLEVKDLPDAWNAGMRQLIGAVPPDDKRGCLQDIHWYCGAFGYFPAYALGAVLAAQLAEKMKKDIPDIEGSVMEGRFDVWTGWLRENVQKHGCLYKPQDLIMRATGEKLSAAAFKRHLAERYLEGTGACKATSAPVGLRRA